MRFAVETWEPEYGTPGDTDALDASTDVVTADVERPLVAWEPQTPPPSDPPEVVYFVDGVRRIDARIWVTGEERVIGGSCATVAAGTVACSHSTATVIDARIVRGVFAPPTEGVGPIETSAGVYEYFPVRSGSPEDLYLGIHERMTDLETQTVPRARSDDLIVFDGPLRRRTTERSVGLVKTQHVQYLDDTQLPVVGALGPGQRTPLFLIGSRGSTRWSWYLRLPSLRIHSWAGIVRCESPGAGTVEAAASFADMVTSNLQRFASEPHKESRAPQNLYPIKGLESTLRRRLGDQRLLERALRTAAARS